MRATFTRSIATLALATLAVVAASGAAFGQVTTSGIRGTVTDQNGAPVAGVRITAIDNRSGTTAAVVTDDQGRYHIRNLGVGGPYTVQAEVIGYRQAQRQAVNITLSQPETVNFQLEQTAVAVAPLSVTVEGRDAEFSASRTGSQTTVPVEEIEANPTLSRQITDFATLSPYVNSVEGAPSIAGQNNRFNQIQIDGAVNNDVFGLADSGIPGGQTGAKAISIEAIQELQILTTPFDIRQSNFTGGLLNAVTKAGTNTWKGSAFGFFANESFSSRIPDSDPDEPKQDFSNSQFGMALGGPLVQDKWFIFGALEIQRTSRPTNEGFDPAEGGFGVEPGDATRFIDIMADTHGVDAGTTDFITLDNPRTNIFLRTDLNINQNHRAMLRWNYAHSSQPVSPFRVSFLYALSSAAGPFVSNTNSFVGQLLSQFGSRWSNDLLVNVEFVRDDRDPLVEWGQVEVDAGNTLVAGAEEFSQLNQLDQDIFQLTNNLTGQFGAHALTFGTHNEYYDFLNVFEPRSLGLWEFDSLDDLEANAPSEYVKRVPFPGLDVEDLPAKFSVLQLGFYVQDEWSIGSNFTLTGGIRMDVPIMLDRPRENPEFEQAFGFSTTEIPKSNPVFQPRLGFNWQTDRDLTTQVRGGLGVFAGRAPYVWISNAYGNTGRQSLDLVCSGSNAPTFNPSSPAPNTCLDGSGAESAIPTINVTDPDFKFPTDFKVSLGIDQRLPWGLVATIDGIYTKAINAPFMQELNLIASNGTDPVDGRPTFGTPSGASCGSRGRCFVDNQVSSDFGNVVQLTNTSAQRAWLATIQLNRQFQDWLALRTSYTWQDVEDVQGLFSSQATSNFGRSAIGGDPNDPARTTSSFQRRNKIVISATGRWDFRGGWGVEVTPQYFGQSGSPYSWITRGDPNGDTYRNPVISRDNDLIYIPNNVNELVWESPEDMADFDALINANPCLNEQRGSIMVRNSCNAPFVNRFDLRGVVRLPGGGPNRFEIIFDLINIFAAEFREPSTIDRGLEALRIDGRDSSGNLVYEYRGPDEADDGTITPFSTQLPASLRRFQLGLRYVLP